MTSNPSPWTAHPLVLAAQQVPSPLDMHLGFQIWEPTSKSYVSLPAGIVIDMMALVTGVDVAMLTQQTDAAGAVHFYLPDNNTLSHPAAEIYFLVHTNNLTLSGTANSIAYTFDLPSIWSTEGGWRADDGTLLDRTPFNPIGTSAGPLIYTLGFNYRFRLKYVAGIVNAATGASTTQFPVVRNTVCKVRFLDGLLHLAVDVIKVRDDGIIEGTNFDVRPQSVIELEVWFATESAAGDFPNIDDVTFSNTHVGSTYVCRAPENCPAIAGRTTIGTVVSPYEIILNDVDASATLYCMKNVGELSQFMARMSDGSNGWSWHDLGSLHIVVGVAPPTSSSTSVSFPVGKVFFMEEDNFNRQTHIHETAHQIMWDYGGFSSVGIGALYAGPWADMSHYLREYTTPTHALLEGWAAFVALLSTWDTPLYYDVSAGVVGAPFPNIGIRSELVVGQPWLYPAIKIGWPPSWGESVEGMFAAGLLEVVRRHVIADSGLPSALPIIKDAGGFDLSTSLPWLFLNSPEALLARSRFASVIMQPLLSLRTLSTPTTTDFIEAIRANNPTDWPAIRSCLQGFALALPSITGWGASAATDPVLVSPGSTLEIQGVHFPTSGYIEFRIAIPVPPDAPPGNWGPFSIASIAAHDSTSATIVVPAEPGPPPTDHSYHLQLWTVDGMHEVEHALTYL